MTGEFEQRRRCGAPNAVHPTSAEILAAAAPWQSRSSNANRLCCAVSAKSAEIAPAKANSG
jgi:hypothetical protein